MQKKLLKSANIWQSYSKNKSGPVFFDSQCIYNNEKQKWHKLTDPSHVQTYIHVASDGPITHIHGRTVAAVSRQAKWNVSDARLQYSTTD